MTITPATILGLAGVELDPGDYARRASPLDLSGLSALTVVVPFQPASPLAGGSLYKIGALSGAGDPYGLGPDYTVNATKQIAVGGVGTLVQRPSGVELKAGNNADVRNGEVLLWWQDPVAPPWTLGLDYTNLDGIDPGTSAGVFCQLLMGFVGTGSGGIEANPNQWSASDCGDLADSTIATKGNGWRASWNTITPTTANRDEIRLREFRAGIVQPALTPVGGGAPTWTFKSAIRYRLTFAYASGTLTCTKTASGETTETVKYTATIGTGYLALKVSNGRRGLFENATMGASAGADDVNHNLLASGGLGIGFAVAAGSSLGTGGALVAGTPALLMAGFGGGLPIAYVDEQQVSLSGGTARSGGLVVAGTDDELMGGAPGIFGPHEVWPRAPTKTWCAVRSRMLRNSADVVGVGAEQVYNGAPSAVAMPVQATAQAPGPVDIDVLAEAYNPDLAVAASLVSVGPGEHGTYSVASGRARVVPEPGYQGEARAPYVIRRGSLDSASRLVLDMLKEEIITPIPTGDFPHGPWRRSPVAPTSGPNYRPVSTLNELKTEISNAQSGTHIVLKSDINLSGTLPISRAVSGTDQFYIRGDTETEGSFRRLSGGNIEFNGAKQCTLRDLHLDGVRLKWIDASKVQVECLRVTNIVGDTDPRARTYNSDYQGNCYTGMWSIVDRPAGASGTVDNIMMGFIHYELCKATPFDVSQTERPTRILMTHFFADRRGGASKIYQPGRNPQDGQHDLKACFQYFLDRGADNQHDLFENKHNGTHIRFSTIHMSNCDGGAPLQSKVRHGRIESGSNSALTAHSNIYERLLYIQDGKGGNPSITVRGCHHKVLGCQVRKPDGSMGQGSITVYTGHRDPLIYPGTSEPSGAPCRMVAGAKIVIAGCRGFTLRNEDSAGNEPCKKPDYKENGYSPDQCWIPNSGKTRNVAASGTVGAPAGFKNTVTTAWPDGNAFASVDVDEVLKQLLPADVGPGAYRAAFNP